MREHGCDSIQGYILGKPLPAEQFESFLKNGAHPTLG
jgi:EAL domain-containing protein (putative c-di-GMP-specific phosphodiesterase class I)